MHAFLRFLAALAIVATGTAQPPTPASIVATPAAKPVVIVAAPLAAPSWFQTSTIRVIPPDFRHTPDLIVAPLRGQLTRGLPGQIVRPLSGQVTGALPGQMIRPLPGQITGPLPGQIVSPLPGQIVP